MSETTLGALAQSGVLSLGDGYRTKQSELTESGFRIIRVADVRDGRISLDSPDFVSADFERQIGAKRAVAGDVLLTTKGTVGRVAIVPKSVEPAVYSPQLCWFRVIDPTLIESRFLAYWLQSEAFLAQSSYMQGNTDMAPYISLSDLRSSKIILPPLAKQQAIAEVLGALDDKIAANTALAATALELADKLFPPESGGTSTRLADVVAVTKGNSYRSADLGPSDHALVTLKSITRDGRYAIEGLKQFTGQYRPQQVISPGEIVVAQTDLTQAAEVVGRAVRVPASDDYTLVASLDLAIVRPLRGIDQTYLLGLLRQPQFREHCRSNTTGTTVLHLRSGAIEEFAAQLADSEVQAVYARATLPLQQVADSAAAENRTLAATRDALLPQLMSGKLRVRDAEEMIAQAGV